MWKKGHNGILATFFVNNKVISLFLYKVFNFQNFLHSSEARNPQGTFFIIFRFIEKNGFTTNLIKKHIILDKLNFDYIFYTLYTSCVNIVIYIKHNITYNNVLNLKSLFWIFSDWDCPLNYLFISKRVTLDSQWYPSILHLIDNGFF